MKKQIGFNSEEKENGIDIEDYKNSWVIVGLRNNLVIPGRLNETYSDRITLMPYQSTNFYGGRQLSEIVREGLPLLIEKQDITSIRPTCEENVVGNCEWCNRQCYLDEIEKQNKIRNSVKGIIIVSR